jgi:hypothetical protein
MAAWKNVKNIVVMIANGIFHPNGMSECVMAGRNLERQKVQVMGGKPIRHEPVFKVTVQNQGPKRSLPATLW